MSIHNLLNIGVNSLTAYRGAMEQSSQNAANVGTPGYSRRRGTLASLSLGRDVPAGVNFKNPRRIIDAMANTTVRRARSQSNELSNRFPTLQSLEAILAPVDGDLGQRLGEFFDALGPLSARAGGRQERTQLLTVAETTVESFRNTSAQLNTLQRPLIQSAEDQTNTINSLSQQIADLNRAVRSAEGGRDEAADLRDRRDVLMDELSGLVHVDVLEHKDGAVTVSLRGGNALVSGDQSATMEARLDGDTLRVSFQQGDGTQEISLRNSGIGGALGATLTSHNEDLQGALEALDEVAFSLAQSFNEIHREGVGLDGVSGRDFFTVDGAQGAASTLRLSSDVANNTSAIATTTEAGLLPAGNDLLQQLEALRGDGIDGLDGLSLDEALNTLQFELGREMQGLEGSLATAQDQEALFENIKAATSGVSLDEEIADLLRYQRGFEAASRLVEVADETMQTLLNLV